MESHVAEIKADEQKNIPDNEKDSVVFSNDDSEINMPSKVDRSTYEDDAPLKTRNISTGTSILKTPNTTDSDSESDIPLIKVFEKNYKIELDKTTSDEKNPDNDDKYQESANKLQKVVERDDHFESDIPVNTLKKSLQNLDSNTNECDELSKTKPIGIFDSDDDQLLIKSKTINVGVLSNSSSDEEEIKVKKLQVKKNKQKLKSQKKGHNKILKMVPLVKKLNVKKYNSSKKDSFSDESENDIPFKQLSEQDNVRRSKVVNLGANKDEDANAYKTEQKNLNKRPKTFKIKSSDESDDEPKPHKIKVKQVHPKKVTKNLDKATVLASEEKKKQISGIDSDQSDEDEKPLCKIIKKPNVKNFNTEGSLSGDEGYLKNKKLDTKKKITSDQSNEDEKPLKYIHEKRARSSDSDNGEILSSDEDVISKRGNKEIRSVKKRKLNNNSINDELLKEDDENVVLRASKKNSSLESSSEEENFDVSKESKENNSDSDEPLSNIAKKKAESESDDKPLSKLSKKTTKNEKQSAEKEKVEKDDSTLKKFKRYIRAAGLFVRYDIVLENYTSKKAKVQKLKDILQEAGLKGNPTLQNCKKLKLKRERKKEIQELDLNNIISNSGSGRAKRNVLSLYQSINEETEEINSTSEPQKNPRVFSRLVGIVDREDSD